MDPVRSAAAITPVPGGIQLHKAVALLQGSRGSKSVHRVGLLSLSCLSCLSLDPVWMEMAKSLVFAMLAERTRK